MFRMYILDKSKTPIPIEDAIKWGRWFNSNNQQVANTKIDDIQISTIFLGLDHGDLSQQPILFETMIFGGKHDGYQTRCCTYAEALAEHCGTTLKVIQSVLS